MRLVQNQLASDSVATTAAGLATVLSAEVGQVVFSLALATLGVSSVSRKLLYASMKVIHNGCSSTRMPCLMP